MMIKTREFLSTVLVALVAVPYLGYVIRGEMPFVEDPRGMAAVGLVLGTVAYAVLSRGDPSDLTDKVEDVLALVTFVLGFTAFALAGTAAAELLLAVFMGGILLTWAVKMMDHAGVLYDRTTGHA